MADRNSRSLAADIRAATQPGEAHASGWMRGLGVATIAVVVVLSLQAHPSPAFSGTGLAVTLAVLVLLASLAALLRGAGEDWRGTAALIAIIAASCTLVWTQRGGPGVAGLFVTVGNAGMRLPTRRSLGTLAVTLAAFALAAAHAHRAIGLIAASELGIVAFYLVASFARSTQEAHAQTQRLLVELETSRQAEDEAAALRERSRIAREIHDVLAHSLSGLMLQIEGARMLAASPNANGEVPAALDRAHHLARAGLDEARRAIGALRDEDLPGPDRLERLAADFSRDSSIETTLEVTGVQQPLDSETSLTLFRVAQEALTNSRRHAQPQRVELQLDYETSGTRLVIRDHTDSAGSSVDELAGAGAGPPSSDAGGYGLTGMRERAELLGGQLHAGPTSDGFRVELWLPA